MPAMNTSTAAVLGSVLVATSLLTVAPADAAPAVRAHQTLPARPATRIVQPIALPTPRPIALPTPRPAAAVVSRSASRLDPVPPVQYQNGRLASALAVARQQIGDPYVYGASGPRAFDCSGLVQYALREAGLGSIPRTAAEQAAVARHIDRTRLEPGDLMFFSRGGSVYHVGFFVGWDNGTALILHAPHPGARVQISSVWTNNWFAGTLT